MPGGVSLRNQSPQSFDIVSHSLQLFLHIRKHHFLLIQIVLIVFGSVPDCADVFWICSRCFCSCFSKNCSVFAQSQTALAHEASPVLPSAEVQPIYLEKSSGVMTLWRILNALTMSSLGGASGAGGDPTPAPGGPRGGPTWGCLSLTMGGTAPAGACGCLPSGPCGLYPFPLPFPFSSKAEEEHLS